MPTTPPAPGAHPACRRLRTERTAAGLSLQQLADISGIAAVVIGSYERGDRNARLRDTDRLLAPFGLEVVVRPIGADEPDAFQRGYDAAVAVVCQSLGVRATYDLGFPPGRPITPKPIQRAEPVGDDSTTETED
jgi:transcriptional regulator with XRE-family HTH domain